MSRPIPPSYKTRNWPAYNEALKKRGSLTIWFDPEMAWVPPPTGKRGRQPEYSDAAIQTCLTMKVLLGMALRQTTGFVESLLRLIGLDWAVPDYSTLSRLEGRRNWPNGISAIKFLAGVMQSIASERRPLVGRDDRAIITINARSNEARQRFSLGHELGHWERHRGQILMCQSENIGGNNRKPPKEAAADRFATA